MTLEEAIEHAEEAEKMKLHKKLNEIILGTEAYKRELQEHTQTAEWLRELQAWRKAYDDCVNTDYESIDDSVRRFIIIGQVVTVKNVFADIRRTDDEHDT